MSQLRESLQEITGQGGGSMMGPPLIAFGVVAIVAIIAGFFSPAAGLAIVALGLLAVVILDYVT